MENYDAITMIPVSSSNVAAIGYDETTQILCIEFLNSSRYIYKGVPSNEFSGLQNAPSIGSYLHRNIKNRFPYERIS